MDRFSKFNPKSCFLFFVLEIVLCLLLFNPAFLAVSLLSALFYDIKLEGKKAVKRFFTFILPLILFIGLFNMIFAHYGDTVLFTVFSADFTLESFFYGINQGIMFSSVILWLSCYSMVMTSDKFLSVFSKTAPNCALVFSMVLSFIPRLRKNAEEINDAGKLIETGESRLKKSISSFSALITMTLEESIEVSDSMKARGFNKNRRAYSKYGFSFSDGVIIAVSIILFAVMLYYKISGKTLFVFEPVMAFDYFSPLSLAIYAVMSFLPLITDLWEDAKWLYLKQKI
ncbi:MAG: energy-coupling factor transporter transmembrane component T [Eubacterium sp.]